MLKLSASFSKKVPVEGQEFSSQSYHASVEVELPDGLSPERLTARIHETFALVRTSVEHELHTGGDAVAPPAAAPPNGNGPHGEARTGAPAPITQKQRRFLVDIALRRGMDLAELDAAAFRQFGVRGTQELSRPQASALIDSLQQQTGSDAKGRAA